MIYYLPILIALNLIALAITPEIWAPNENPIKWILEQSRPFLIQCFSTTATFSAS